MSMTRIYAAIEVLGVVLLIAHTLSLASVPLWLALVCLGIRIVVILALATLLSLTFFVTFTTVSLHRLVLHAWESLKKDA